MYFPTRERRTSAREGSLRTIIAGGRRPVKSETFAERQLQRRTIACRIPARNTGVMPMRFMKLMQYFKPTRRWAQFSLGTMMLAVTVLCLVLADYVSPVRRLERQLRDPDEFQRVDAAVRLGYMGSEARSATRSLLRAIDDTCRLVGAKAVWAVSRVSGRKDLLAPMLDHDDGEVRLAAAEGLLWIGDDPTKLLPKLLELAVDYPSQVRDIFQGLGPNEAATLVPLLLDSLSTTAEAGQSNSEDPAVELLDYIAAPAATVVPALIERLDDDRPRVRKAAAEQLLRLGASAKQAAPSLRIRLRDPDPGCAAACAAALGAIDPSDNEFLAVLKQSLRSQDMRLAYRASAYVLLLGPIAADASDEMVAFFCDYQWAGSWRSPAGSALKRLGPRAISALNQTLEEALADRGRIPATPDRFQERLDTLAWDALPVLRRALKWAQGMPDAAAAAGAAPEVAQLLEKIERVLQWAIEQAVKRGKPDRRSATPYYLGVIGAPAAPATPTLIAALDHESFRHSAIYALGAIGKGASPSVPRLLPLLDSEDIAMRSNVRESLKRIGGDHEAARVRLRPLLNGGDRLDQANSAILLAAMGERADQIVPKLIELAKDPSFGGAGQEFPIGTAYFPGMHKALIASLAAFGPAALPELLNGLQGRDPVVRRIAAEALAAIGPEARAAVPDLIEMLDDDFLRDAAAEALGRIGSDAHAGVPKLLAALERLRIPPDPSDYNPAEYTPSGYDWSQHDPSDYFPLLHGLAGIGTKARDASPEVLRLTNFDDWRIRHAAIFTLARIDPSNPYLITCLRRWLAEWERKSANQDHAAAENDLSCDEFVDAVWELGPRAEPLAPDLERLMTTAPLLECRVRCYAASALARFASYRRTAETCLENVQNAGFLGTSNNVNLAHVLLQRIKGTPKREIEPILIISSAP